MRTTTTIRKKQSTANDDHRRSFFRPSSPFLLSVAVLFGVAARDDSVRAFSFVATRRSSPRRRVAPTRAHDDVVVDVDASPVDDGNDDGTRKTAATTTTTLLDMMKEAADPSLAKVRLPFIDPSGNNVIECEPRFAVRHEGVEYTIGTPHDHTVGILGACDDDEKNMLRFVDEKEAVMDDLFRIASMALSDVSDDKLRLKRTPGTLTIKGDLDAYVEEGRRDRELRREAWNKGGGGDADAATSSWAEKLFDMEMPEDEDAWVEETFRKYLGNEYVELEDANKEEDDAAANDEIASLFDSVLGKDENDDEELANMMKEIFGDGEDVDMHDLPDLDLDLEGEEDNPSQNEGDPVAERLYTFNYKEKQYSLVRMTTPYIVVGREDPDVESRRVLLTPQESAVVLPELEKLCRAELAGALGSEEGMTP